MTANTLAALIFAAYAIAMTVWAAFTRNGRRAAYLLILAVHRLTVRATGTHRFTEPPSREPTARELLCELAVHMLPARRVMVSAASGDGPAPAPSPASGAGPQPTAPQPLLSEHVAIARRYAPHNTYDELGLPEVIP